MSQQEFSKALNREIEASAELLMEHQELLRWNDESSKDHPLKYKTIYIGGGTPSVLPLSAIAEAVKTLQTIGYKPPYDEFTIEVNPEDIVGKGQDYVEGLMNLGVNRFSMGVQSFDNDILKWMNRRHTAQAAIKAYNILEKSGIENISIDLIFGLPQLNNKKWKETIKQALEISQTGKFPPHISSYQLSVEPTSTLAQMLENGLFVEAPDYECRNQYDILCQSLAEVGYNHYEISNFAQPSYEAVHNSAYWKHFPYIGFGPGAHSFFITKDGKQIRRWNLQDLRAYVNASKVEDFSIIREEEVLNSEQIFLEKIMLGLRTSKGLEVEVLETYNPKMFNQLLEQGKLVKTKEGFIRIPESYFFVSDSIIASLCHSNSSLTNR